MKTGALRLGSLFTERGVAIIMYHSVMNDSSLAASLGGITHAKQVFRAQMEIVARQFHAVSMDDVLAFLQNGKTLPPRAVVITFDDGYVDNYEAAVESLSPLGIPGAFYVTVDCIERQLLPWPSLLRHAFLISKKNRWTEADGRAWSLSSTEQRLQAFQRASEYCCKLSGAPQSQFVKSVEDELRTEPLRPARPMMNWDELRKLVRKGHTVGSHTMTHPNMAQITESEARAEFLEAKQKMEKELSSPVVHFSYPCPALQPHWNDGTVSASRQAGYQTAVTTNGGLVRKNDDSLKLRRIRPTKTVDGLRGNLECAFLGRKV